MKAGRYLILILAAAMLSSGCSDKKNPQSADDKAAQGSLTAIISGALSLDFEAGAAYAMYRQGDGMFFITGEKTISGVEYSIVFTLFRDPGTFTAALKSALESGEGDGMAVFSRMTGDEESDDYYTVSGTITVTESTDSKLKGTFQFTARNMMDGTEITAAQGTFDVPYL